MAEDQKFQKTTCKAWLTWFALLAFLAFCTIVAQSCVTINVNLNQKQPTTTPIDTNAIESAWY